MPKKKSAKAINPSDLKCRLENLKLNCVDEEIFHMEADILIWEIMSKLGYKEAIDYLKKQELWYG